MEKTSLVEMKDNKPTTTSFIIADGVGRQHKNILETIRKYDNDISEFGLLRFKTRPRSTGTHGGGDTEYALLNEEQTTFLFTLLRNSPIVVEFKKRIVKEFFNLRRKLSEAKVRQQNIGWQEQRSQGKLARRSTTDAVQAFIEYAKTQGSSKPNFYYKHVTNATYKALFIVKDKSGKSFRDMLDTMQLSFLQTAEYVAAKALADGMEQQLHYKDIFILAKERIQAFAGTVPTTGVISDGGQLRIDCAA